MFGELGVLLDFGVEAAEKCLDRTSDGARIVIVDRWGRPTHRGFHSENSVNERAHWDMGERREASWREFGAEHVASSGKARDETARTGPVHFETFRTVREVHAEVRQDLLFQGGPVNHPADRPKALD